MTEMVFAIPALAGAPATKKTMNTSGAIGRI